MASAAEQLWDKVVSDFRQLCLLRRQKKWIESDIILSSDLPRSIAGWSEAFEGEPAAKKARLDAMFQIEQRRIDDASLATDIMKTRLTEEILPAICAQMFEQVRASVMEEIRAMVREQVRIVLAENSRPSLTDRNVRSSVVAEGRVAFDDVAGVIDLALAEEHQRANRHHLELSACP